MDERSHERAPEVSEYETGAITSKWYDMRGLRNPNRKSASQGEGIQAVHVSLALSRATVHYEPREIGMQAITAKITKLGYKATGKLSHPQAGIEAETRAYRTRFAIAACLSIPLCGRCWPICLCGFNHGRRIYSWSPCFNG